MNNPRQSLAPGRDVVITIGTRLFINLLAFVSSIVTARFLGPGGRGDYFVAVTFSAMLTQFGNLGLQSSNTYYVARNRELLGPLLANSLWVSLLVGGGGAVLAAGVLQLSHAVESSQLSYLWLAAAFVPSTLFFMLASNLLVGVQRIGIFNVYQLGHAVLNLALNAVVGLLGLGVKGFLIASVIGTWIPAAVLLASLARSSGTNLRFQRDVFSSGFRYGIKAYIATLLGFLVLRSNVFLLSHLTPAAEVGYYSIAAQVADVLGILPASVALALFPGLVQADTGRWKATMRSLAVTGSILTVACLAALLLAGPFVRLSFGRGFGPAIPILLWMLPGVLFLGLTSIVSQYLAAEGFPRALPICWLVALILVSGISWALIPLYGGRGAAMALSITYTVLCIGISGYAWMFNRNLKHKAAGITRFWVPTEA